ncbi:SpoIIE family protein phosphatase [Pontibacter sp. G13]|uniref:GAF domain-containing SpoIIE family protein phosphatase n=1 Tax=Pontibacter sp. G13 TaxID=3074898 RepID=UPI00288AF898|nr:SpoIIE family protein phosphatase [Pontibacter sp. G13]WNJ21201.1 SpoIIE family protein phosphatase [Pontibacter sp. G13]
MRPKIINGILLTAALMLWGSVLAIHLVEDALNIFEGEGLLWGWQYRLAMSGFVFTTGLFIQRVVGAISQLHVTTQLWRLFMIGMVGILMILFVSFANRLSVESAVYPNLISIFYCLILLVTVIFSYATVFIYRRFVLYQRTRRKQIVWNLFMGFLFWALILWTFNLRELGLFSYIPLLVIALLLSANVRWISYLNFDQKLRALGILVMIMLVIAVFVMTQLSLSDQLGISLPEGTRQHFLTYPLVFGLSYTFFSILVLFFNLPTSSVFEKESFEFASFNRINAAIQANMNFSEILEALLDASMVAANAKVGWIEMRDGENGSIGVEVQKGISGEEISELKLGKDLTSRILREKRYELIRNTQKHRQLKQSNTPFRSLLAVPISSSQNEYGAIYLANELNNSFEDVSVQSVWSFAEQAGMALENARLIKNSIELERYQEQLKIAKDVQTKLLPNQLPSSERISFSALSENAQEVGGDYYDVVEPESGVYRVAIGDVSGKGTTAAFYMAEIKGIFHALTRLDMSVKDFLVTANGALSDCMQPGFFMTLTYLEIDTKARQVEMIRAGHCPAFYYQAETGELSQLKDGTLGLGILRDDSYARFVKQTDQFEYAEGDFLVLYTDGINEARDEQGEEFGLARLQESILSHRNQEACEMAKGIVQTVKSFTHSDLQDDYTVLIIRFH